MERRKERSSLLSHLSIASASHNVPIQVDLVLESGLLLHGMDCTVGQWIGLYGADWTLQCRLDCLELTGLYGANWTVQNQLDLTGLRKQREILRHSTCNEFHHQQKANLISLTILSNRFKYTLSSDKMWTTAAQYSICYFGSSCNSSLGAKCSDIKVDKPNSSRKDSKLWVSVHFG